MRSSHANTLPSYPIYLFVVWSSSGRISSGREGGEDPNDNDNDNDNDTTLLNGLSDREREGMGNGNGMRCGSDDTDKTDTTQMVRPANPTDTAPLTHNTTTTNVPPLLTHHHH